MAQLVARWAAYTRDGDMIGGDLPGWLGTLFRKRGVTALTDRRGECVYAGCPHYRKCFIERSARASADADLVIANHALVMVNAARGKDVAQRPTRIVFDEGHHVFEAADSTFSAELTGAEAIELRRWVIGPEKGSRAAAGAFPPALPMWPAMTKQAPAPSPPREAAEGITRRWLAGSAWSRGAFGAIEGLLAAVRATVFARDESGGQEAAMAGNRGRRARWPLYRGRTGRRRGLAALRRPLIQLGLRLEAILADPPDWLDGRPRADRGGARNR
jgi:ATP-dependent DNA helicase DinG